MNPEELFKLYEKQYYHEIEVRDKLNSRLQIPLAVLVAILGFLGFMLQNRSSDAMGLGVLIFWMFFAVSAVSITLAIIFFRKSWFGHTDKLLPTAAETEKYREQLIAHYAEYDEKDKLVEDALKKYLSDYYIKFSSVNTVNNDSRSYNLYKTTVALTVATVSTFFAFVPYHLLDLDKGNHPKPLQVEIVNNRKSEEIIMPNKIPPPPPPPPPPRDFRGNVPKTPTPPPPKTK